MNQFKRKRVNDSLSSDVAPSVVVYPSLESTVLLETGGITGLNSGSSTTDMSGNLGGILRFIYNDPLWSNDLYTTTLQNSLLAIFVSVYTNGAYCSGIIPVCLPRQVLRHDMHEEGVESKSDFLKIQQSISYALNLLFSKPIQIIDMTSGIPLLQTIGDADPIFPIVQTTVLPPLLWDICTLTGQLYLKKNTSFVGPTGDYEIAFSLCTFKDVFFPILSSNQNRITGDGNGWFGKGAHLYGFGELDIVNHQYHDRYFGQSELFFKQIISSCNYSSPVTATINTWHKDIVSTFFLSTSIIMSERTTGAIYSRYILLKSQLLSRLQIRPTLSNTSISLTDSIATLYDIIEYSGKYQDGKNLLSSVPVIYFDPYNYSNNEIDLRFSNEFNENLFAWTTEEYWNQTNSETLEFIPGMNTIPVVYQALDPYNTTNGPRYDCIFPYEQINQNFIIEPSNGNKLSYKEVWSAKPSMATANFLRAIGA
jgi:hypothetical protein